MLHTAPPAGITLALMPDAHSHIISNALHLASAGGNVTFCPHSSLAPDQVAAIAAQLISTVEQWRDQNLRRDAELTGALLKQTRQGD